MNSNLFFCRPWDDDRHSRRLGAWRVIVSDAVSGNDTRTAAQFHMVMLHRENAARVSDLFPGISESLFRIFTKEKKGSKIREKEKR